RRRLRTPGLLLARELDLAGIHVEPACNDKLLGPAGNGEIAIGRINPADVTAAEPAAGVESGCGRLRLPGIARKHLWPAEDDLAIAPVGNEGTGPVHDGQLHPGQGEAHRTDPTRSLIGIRDVEAGFGAAVALQGTLAEQSGD